MQRRNGLILAAIAVALAGWMPEGVPGSLAYARRGADDGPGDDNGGRGSDDGPGDDNGGRGRGSDDGPGDDNGGGGGGGGGGGDWVRTRAPLARAPGSPDGDTRGHVEVRTRGTRQRISIEAEWLDASVTVEFFVANAGGALMSAGSRSTDASGHAELELDTGDGASLPGGASTVAELAGRAVEVRTAAGEALLQGAVPGMGGGSGGSTSRGRDSVRSDDGSVRAKVDLRSDGRRGREQFRVDVRGLPAGSTATLAVDDGAGGFTVVATGTVAGNGRIRWRMDSRRGDAMPLGAATVRDLADRPFEVRVDGTPVLSGQFPRM